MNDRLPQEKPQTFADYMMLHKKIKRENENSPSKKPLKIALLSSSTVTGIKEVLGVKCFSLGIAPEFYEAQYNQFAQDILNADSPLYRFKADLTILSIDTMNLFGEDFFFPYRLSDDGRKKLAHEKYEEITGLLATLTRKTSGKIILHNFRVPYYSPLGILENKQAFGFFEMVKDVNEQLERRFKDNRQVFIYDYDLFCAKHGKERVADNKMYYLGDIKLGFDWIPFLCEDYMAYIKPLTARTKKCLVLDLDNTLWGGVIGEDGIEGIRLGPTPEGRPFLEFQKYILNLFERGVLLAVNSANNPEEVDQVFNEHPSMVLKKEHFAAMEINWNDKISNMKALAQKMNIGLDAFVFLDDVKANREMIQKALPEIYVPDLPEDPSDYVKTLTALNDFNTLQLTEEDKTRNLLYAADRQRNVHKQKITDITQYLKDLNMVVSIAKADALTIPRISQLTQKTNQFNMTTRRYLEEDIKKFSDSDRFLVLSVRVEDKFGDNGITGVAIVKKDKDTWTIDTFLLSCRVIGRRIEEVLLAFLLAEARKASAKFVVGEFIPTPKNSPARDFYKQNYFALKGHADGKEVWELDAAKDYHAPDFIKVLCKN